MRLFVFCTITTEEKARSALLPHCNLINEQALDTPSHLSFINSTPLLRSWCSFAGHGRGNSPFASRMGASGQKIGWVGMARVILPLSLAFLALLGLGE